MRACRTQPYAACLLVSMLTLLGTALAAPPSPGGVRTGIFGLDARGNRFVYVFDRSASMAEPAGRPLAAAKQELLRSLDDLGEVQQFYLIFYNQAASIYSVHRPGEGGFSLPHGKIRRRPGDLLSRCEPTGATRHFEALAAACRLHPDVIFVLTDADAGDDLSQDELERLGRWIGAARCMVVQFGSHQEQRSPRMAELAAALRRKIYRGRSIAFRGVSRLRRALHHEQSFGSRLAVRTLVSPAWLSLACRRGGRRADSADQRLWVAAWLRPVRPAPSECF